MDNLCCCLNLRFGLGLFAAASVGLSATALTAAIYMLHINAILVSGVFLFVYSLLLSGIVRRKKDDIAEWLFLATVQAIAMLLFTGLWIYFVVTNLMQSTAVPETDAWVTAGSLVATGVYIYLWIGAYSLYKQLAKEEEEEEEGLIQTLQ